MELMHHGVPNQKWGVRNGPPYPLHRTSFMPTNYTKAQTPMELHDYFRKVKYSNYNGLQSPEKTARTKKGSCHDQSLLAASELKRMGYNPKIIFVMEYDPKTNQGGMTHTLCTYKEGNVINWFEPSTTWSERSGITAYTSEKAIRNSIQRAHGSGEYGNKSLYSSLAFGEYRPSDHTYGEDLGDFVNECLEE